MEASGGIGVASCVAPLESPSKSSSRQHRSVWRDSWAELLAALRDSVASRSRTLIEKPAGHRYINLVASTLSDDPARANHCNYETTNYKHIISKMVRVIVTGGSGKAGRHVIPYLIAQGHEVFNLDIIPFPDSTVPVYTLKTDLTNSGQVFNAFTSLFNMEEYGLDQRPPLVPDVVIHLAAYARNMLVPDNELFNGNTQSTYNVIEVACKLGVKKIMICSSETTYSVCFWQGERDYDVFPLEEDYDVNPMGKSEENLLAGSL